MVGRIPALIAALTLAALASAQYEITDLGTLPGGSQSYAYDVNAAGEVVGFSMSTNGARGFIWDSANGMLNLGVLRNDPSSFALGINDSSRVAGYSGSGVMRTAFDWTLQAGIGDLGTFEDDDISLGIDINGSGQVVGVSGFDQGIRRAFLYDPVTGMSDLGTLAGRVGAFARGINASTQIVGHTVGSDPAAFFWDGSMSELPNLVGGTSSTAFAINDSGITVGWAIDALGNKHAVIWQLGGGNPTKIVKAASQWIGSEALNINSLGQVVGYGTFENKDEAFIYSPGSGTKALSDVIGAAAAGWTLQRAQGINDSGTIVGYGTINGEVHAFSASPVPEPASLLALLIGGSLLALRRRKKTA